MRHGSSLGNHGLGELKPSRIGIISDHWLETNAQRGQRRDERYWQILGKPTEVTAVTLQGDRQRGTVQDDPRESQHISQRRPFKQTAGDAVTSTQAVKKFWLKYLFVGPVRSSCFKGRQLVSLALTPLRAQFSPDSGEEEALPSSLRHAHPAAHGWEAPNTAPWNWTQDLINEIRYFKQLPRNAKRGKGNWKRCFSPVPGQGQAAIPAPCLQPPRCGQEPPPQPARPLPVLGDADDPVLLGHDRCHVHHLLRALHFVEQEGLAGQRFGLRLRRHEAPPLREDGRAGRRQHRASPGLPGKQEPTRRRHRPRAGPPRGVTGRQREAGRGAMAAGGVAIPQRPRGPGRPARGGKRVYWNAGTPQAEAAVSGRLGRTGEFAVTRSAVKPGFLYDESRNSPSEFVPEGNATGLQQLDFSALLLFARVSRWIWWGPRGPKALR